MKHIDEKNMFISKNYFQDCIEGIDVLTMIHDVIDESFQSQYMLGAFNGYINLVLYYSARDAELESKDYLDKSLEILNIYHLSEHALLSYYRAYAIYAAEVLADAPMAIHYTKLAIDLADKLGEKNILVRLRSNFGAININLGNYDIAKGAIEETVHYFEQMMDETKLIFEYYNLASVYSNLGDYSQALKYYTKSFEMASVSEIDHIYYSSAVGISHCLRLNGKYEEALHKINEVIDFTDADDINRHQITVLISKAAILHDQGENEHALELLKSYEKNLIEVNNDGVTIDYYEMCEKISEELADFETAYFAYRKQIELKEKINQKNSDKSLSLQIKEEYSRNVKKLEVMANVGKDLSLFNNIEDVIKEVVDKLSDFMSINTIGVGIIVNDHIRFEHVSLDGKKYEVDDISLDDDDSMAVLCVKENREIMINDLKNDYRIFLKKQFVENKASDDNTTINALMYAPLRIKDVVVGFVTIQSYKRFAYSTEDMEIFKIITSYLAIAMHNINQSRTLERLSITDELTGLYNRRGFTEMFDGMVSKHGSSPSAMLVIDMDYFKKVNDKYGHIAGDYVLKEFSLLVDRLMDNHFIAGRLGGEEFSILAFDISREEIIDFAEKLRLQVEKYPFDFNEQRLKITISIGICYCEHGMFDKYDRCYSRADEALYEAKAKGRNRVVLADSNISF